MPLQGSHLKKTAISSFNVFNAVRNDIFQLQCKLQLHNTQLNRRLLLETVLVSICYLNFKNLTAKLHKAYLTYYHQPKDLSSWCEKMFLFLDISQSLLHLLVNVNVYRYIYYDCFLFSPQLKAKMIPWILFSLFHLWYY